MESISSVEHCASSLPHNFDLGTTVFHPASGELTDKYSEKYIHLEPKVAKVLLCLLTSEAEVVTREELFDFVWPNALVSDDSLNRCISMLRKKIRSIDKNIQVKTHPKIGFSIATQEPITLTECEVNNGHTHTPEYVSKHRIPLIFLGAVICITIILTILIWTIMFPKLAKELSTSLSSDQLQFPIQFVGLDNRSGNVQASKIERELSEVLINHPQHSVTNSTQGSTDYELTGQIVENNERFALHWRLTNTKTNEEFIAGRESFTLSSVQQTAVKVATKLVQTLGDKRFAKSNKKADYINASANYFLEKYHFQRSNTALIAEALLTIDEPHKPLLTTFVDSLSINYGQDPNRAAHINLALTTSNNYLELTPGDDALQKLTQKLYLYDYKWQKAANLTKHLSGEVDWLSLNTGKHTAKQLESAELLSIGLSLEEKLIDSLAKKQFSAASLILEQLITLDNAFPYLFIYHALISKQIDKKFDPNAIVGSLNAIAANDTIQTLIALYQGANTLSPQELSLQISQLNLPSFYKQYLFLQYNLFEQYFSLAQQLTKNKQLNLVAFWLYNNQEWRSHPKYPILMKSLKLQQYWQTNGFPDFKDNTNN